MKRITQISLALAFLIMACNSEKSNSLADKKAQLEKMKVEQIALTESIGKLQVEIAKLDTSAAKMLKTKLVALDTIRGAGFEHFIELQGTVSAENISYIAPRGQPGVVRAINVRKGQKVSKGQLLLRLDDAVARQNLNVAKQGLSQIETQLAFARDLYNRQQSLWKQNIGTEVQVLTAKNNVESLESQLQSVKGNVKLVQEMLNTTLVTSDVNGVVDDITIRVGETFTGSPMAGYIRVVNASSLKASATIPETYLKSISMGTDVVVKVQDINKTYNTKISFISSTIDPNTRGFTVDAILPKDNLLKPNQIASLAIKDYNANKALVVPLNVLQNDEKGKYVMVASQENGHLIARKKMVNIGELNGNDLEIKSGVKAGDVVITEGYQDLYDGQYISTQQ
ncbi:MAG: efflux RND transporter periplasmic adaptor subunit [Saprospiraceae bacterium]